MLLQTAPGSTSACWPSHQHGGDNGGGCHGVRRASTGTKLGGLTPPQPQSPLARAQRALTRPPLSEAQIAQATRQRPTRAAFIPGRWGEVCVGRSLSPGRHAEGPPRRWRQLSWAFPSTAGSCFT